MIPFRLSFLVIALAALVSAGFAQGDDHAPDEAARKLARKLEAKVSSTRGLEIKSPTEIGAYTEDELRSFLSEKVGEQLKPELVDAHVRAMVLLGLYEPETDLKEVTLALLGEQVAGFYDPDEKQLFIINRGADGKAMASMDRIIMAHELVHALQDQHFDLKGMLESVEDNDDVVSARKSLVEGDATWCMLAFEQGIGMTRMSIPMMPDSLGAFMKLIEQARKMGMGGMMDDGMFSMDALQNTPAVDADEMIFTYYGGAKFCLHLLKDPADKKAVNLKRLDAAFRNPPRSTEQILHPKKYDIERDDPTTVILPEAETVLPGTKTVASNTLGELRIRTWLHELGWSAKDAKPVHGGWDGDRYALWSEEGKADTLVWASVWDSEKDAMEFVTAALGFLGAEERDGVGDYWSWSEGGMSAVARRGARVFLVRNFRGDGAAFERLVANTRFEMRADDEKDDEEKEER